MIGRIVPLRLVLCGAEQIRDGSSLRSQYGGQCHEHKPAIGRSGKRGMKHRETRYHTRLDLHGGGPSVEFTIAYLPGVLDCYFTINDPVSQPSPMGERLKRAKVELRLSYPS
jgi:hypothetical protein